MTAGQAMDVLKGEGLVRSEHGGTGRGAYDVEMRQLGLEPGVELVELGPVTPPPEIAERLGLKAGEGPDPSAPDVRRGPADAARISCVPWSFAEGAQMVERDSGPGGRRPTPREARFLRLTDPRPVFNLFRTAFVRPGHRSRSVNTSCRVIAGCSPASGPRTSVLTVRLERSLLLRERQ
jgi:hypothetical protein